MFTFNIHCYVYTTYYSYWCFVVVSLFLIFLCEHNIDKGRIISTASSLTWKKLKMHVIPANKIKCSAILKIALAK